MRAIVLNRATAPILQVRNVPDPTPGPHEALVRISAAALNFGEVAHAFGTMGSHLRQIPDGTVMGNDAAGVVVEAAADGSGPAAGATVVTLGIGGAWAELRAVNTDFLAEAPAGADFGVLSTLPVAGLSALHGLARLGSILGKRVLVTGASGGVGTFAVQLARHAGAVVVASTSNPDAHGETLRRLGANEIVATPAEVVRPVHGVLDQVGGSQLVDAFRRLAPHGTLVAIGHSSRQGETFDFGDLFGDEGRHDRAIVTFFLGDLRGLGPDLHWLAARVAAGELDPQIGWRGDWSRAEEAYTALLNRRISGKAVLDIN
ncbi:zinc-binding dehydrogenase [Dactylosporangium sp. NPDC000244]|uniref:zinc-binding dehydrogenase n=1 Tax=Dactylosporangium sp. NPDC000244 TaxID=3154365 RepID=UPI003334185C